MRHDVPEKEKIVAEVELLAISVRASWHKHLKFIARGKQIAEMLMPFFCVLWLVGACHSVSIVEQDVLRFGQELEQLLNTTYSPCQDFFGYVCGRTANQTLRRQQEQLRFQQLLCLNNPGPLLAMEQQLLNFYKSCQSSRSLDSLTSTQLYKSSGGWPALESSNINQTGLGWLGLLSQFHEMGAPYFFESRISMQSNKRLITLQPDVTRRHTLRKFEQRVGELLQSFGVEQSRAHIVSLEVLSLERNRRDIIKTERIDDQVQFSYANFKRSSFGNFSMARLDWDAYFRNLLGGKTLKPTDVIVVRQLPRLVDYMHLLQNTSIHRLLNWIWIDYLIDIVAAECQQLADIYAGDVYAHLLQRLSTDRVQLTQMYANIGGAYRAQLVGSVWIDEISEQSSKRFLSQVMHIMLNGDEFLDAAYQDLQLGRRNFYRNMEKLRRFQHKRPPPSPATLLLRQYARGFETIYGLLPKQQHQSLTTPLVYVLLAERFARHLVAAGSSSRTPGAWRSIDSDRQFAQFVNCSKTASDTNAHELLLNTLAQRLAGSTYKEWLDQQPTANRVNMLLAAGKLQLSLQRLYFIGNLLMECPEGQQEHKRQLQHMLLRNTPEFSEAFNCRLGDALYVQPQRCHLAENLALSVSA
ncbi:uncharacterized protein LOC108659640 isoform X3 [Drosophila navojoa]|uniref:uncharacterized protein LOC108659640 isoform X3 n=1 Tax=Drosophila navojoa TaxID=7232 RepID=UPI0011BD845D|nr:uncharacterized protein LOC108659640 isoform X3 [Drosophila navojoa]